MTARIAPPATGVPAAGLGVAVRASLSDAFFNSGRLLAANVIWGLAVVALAIIALAWPLGALLLSPFAALPTAGVFRTAARIVRGQADVGLAEIARSSARDAGMVATVGVGVVGLTFVLAYNVASGLAAGDAAGLVLATFAGWGIVGLWIGALVVWPVLADPARTHLPLTDRLRLAATLFFLEPGRFAGLGLLVFGLTVLGIVLTAAILTVGLSFIALVACRVVYPVADRVEMVGGSSAIGAARSAPPEEA